MGKYVAEMTVKKLIRAGKAVKGARVLVLTFKENVSDIRNTRVIDILSELKEYGVETLVHDPVASPEEAKHSYGIELVKLHAAGQVDAVILAVAHSQFLNFPPERLKEFCGNGNGCGVVIDVKNVLDRRQVEEQGLRYWSL